MKYKLIKSYPNSRETGTIVSPVPQPDTASKTSRYVDSSGRYYGWHEVEDYPEYWKEIKEPTFKVGDWLYCLDDGWNDTGHKKYSKPTSKGDVFRIKEFDKCSFEDWNVAVSDDGRVTYTHKYPNKFRLAATEEIENYLIAEAKKKGFVKGVNYKYLDRPNLGIREIESGDFGYNAEFDTLHDKGFHSYNIYYQGKWAEITKEEQIKIGEYVAKFEYPSSGRNTISFGCKKYTFEEVKELYNICLVFGISQIYAHNHLIDYILLKRIYDKITK